MKRFVWALILTSIFIWSCQNQKTMWNYPEAKKINAADTFFGVVVQDPYRWMENENDPDLKKWIEQENKLTFDYLSKIPFRQKILNRLKEVYNFEKRGAPFYKGGKYFFFKNDGLQNQYVLYYMNNLNDTPKVLLDPNKFSDDGTIALSTIGISKDGKYLGYAISRSGSDWQEIYVKDIEQNKLLQDTVLWAKFSGITWYKDGFFYSRYDKPEKGKEFTTKNLNQKVFYHKLGTKQSQDKFIFGNPEQPEHGFSADISDDEKFLIISEWAGTSGNIIYFKNLEENSDFHKLNENFDYDFAFIDHFNGKLLFLTNYQAPNYKLIAIDPKNPEKENWQDLIAEKDYVLENVYLSKDKIFAKYLKDVKSKIEIYDANGNYIEDLNLPQIGSVGSFNINKDDNLAFFTITSYTLPSTIYKYDLSTNKIEKYWQAEIKGLNLDDFVTEQVFYQSKDGTKIPMFIMHKKDIELNGKNPTLLYGYGGFNISLTPYFDVKMLVWLENGGVYAVANIRGGGEYGEAWHKAGTKFNKQNVFDDFIYAAKYLIEKNYTSSDYLAIRGGSNGGLLIGAVVNQQPELFKVAIPQVGVMDMLRYYRFTIGRAWASDYGLPTESKEMFEYIYKYSPLHNINCEKTYPAILVMTADHDDRVVPAHSFKYTATLQEKCKNNPNPILIRIETKAGHGAGKPTEKILEETADWMSFALYNFGVQI